MKNLVTLLSAVCLVILAGALPSSAQAEVQEAPAPSQAELLEDLFPAGDEVGSCTIEDCGNTGTLYGYGSTCQEAKDDLEDNLYATAEDICNGGLVVLPLDINYGSCNLVLREYRFSGSADVDCKLCNGEFCTPYS